MNEAGVKSGSTELNGKTPLSWKAFILHGIYPPSICSHHLHYEEIAKW